MKAINKLMCSNGTYKNQAGEEKTRWTRVGTLFQKDDGRMKIKLDAIPVGQDFNGWVEAFDMDQEGGNNRGQAQSNQSSQYIDKRRFDQDIPF